MSKILDEVLTANTKYAENFGDKGNLPLPPSRHFVILTCMDARLNPAKYAGLAEGDAHVIRNAGGRASDDATSVGYGGAAGGRAALDALLASCAPGITVVNIDNGYGAACAALRLLQILDQR